MNKEETFEIKSNKIKKYMSDCYANNTLQCALITLIKIKSDIDGLKQLHDQKIKYITEINDTNVNNFYRDIEEEKRKCAFSLNLFKEDIRKLEQEKNKQISELNKLIKSLRLR